MSSVGFCQLFFWLMAMMVDQLVAPSSPSLVLSRLNQDALLNQSFEQILQTLKQVLLEAGQNQLFCFFSVLETCQAPSAVESEMPGWHLESHSKEFFHFLCCQAHQDGAQYQAKEQDIEGHRVPA